MGWDFQDLERRRAQSLERQLADDALSIAGLNLLRRTYEYDYAYQWSWAGFPIIQMPEDVVMVQEILWASRPSIVVECGVAWGGGLALCATVMSSYNPAGRVLGIDLNLDESLAGRLAALNLPVEMLLRKDSSTSTDSIEWVKSLVSAQDSVMVILDSNHSHDHVLNELVHYASIVSPNNFLLACDTIVRDIPAVAHRDRQWGIHGNPHTAVEEFLATHSDFARDPAVNARLVTSFHPGGYLRRIG